MRKYIVAFFCWLFFPVVVVWIWLTHPGKCAVIWKRQLEGTWWKGDHDAEADKIVKCFEGVDWGKQRFNVGGVGIDSDGEYNFYKCKSIDTAIKKLNKFLDEKRR